MSRGYRSSLEESIAEYLTEQKVKFKYETVKIEWEDIYYRKYTPDFILPNGIIIETKGEFTDGQTVSEFNESIMGQIFKPKPNSEVALDLDVEAFNSLFRERVIDFLVEL